MSAEIGEQAVKAARRLAKPVEIERSWLPDEAAMQAALRLVIGLPRVPRPRLDGGQR
jgi:hypothetical protein